MDHAERRRLGRRLQALRKERQLTQEGLAERAGLHPTHVAKIEAGMSWPSVPALLRLAAALEVPPGEFFAPEPDDLDSAAARALQGVARLLQGLSADDLGLVRDLLGVLKRHGRLATGKTKPSSKR